MKMVNFRNNIASLVLLLSAMHSSQATSSLVVPENSRPDPAAEDSKPDDPIVAGDSRPGPVTEDSRPDPVAEDSMPGMLGLVAEDSMPGPVAEDTNQTCSPMPWFIFN